MAKSSPFPSAKLKKVWFIALLLGNPNDIFDTPSIVLTPKFSLTNFIAFNVSIASSCCAETVSAKQSINISSFLIPSFKALSTILLAISSLPSAFGGIPFSSIVSPTIAAPDFLL